jgi:hypothetical protein
VLSWVAFFAGIPVVLAVGAVLFGKGRSAEAIVRRLASGENPLTVTIHHLEFPWDPSRADRLASTLPGPGTAEYWLDPDRTHITLTWRADGLAGHQITGPVPADLLNVAAAGARKRHAPVVLAVAAFWFGITIVAADWAGSAASPENQDAATVFGGMGGFVIASLATRIGTTVLLLRQAKRDSTDTPPV